MGQSCYLCGLEIAVGEKSDDHIVPKHLISRVQPKVKGYDYAGILPTHPECNNRFGPETYCAKALDLIAVLNDENCVSKYQHKKDPNIVMMAINSECLKAFTRRDLQFFRFIDIREMEISEWSSPSFFSGKPKTNPTRDAIFVALAVLAKSAAALLVARHLPQWPQWWRILAMPYSGATNAVDFDNLLGNVKPLISGLRWASSLYAPLGRSLRSRRSTGPLARGPNSEEEDFIMSDNNPPEQLMGQMMNGYQTTQLIYVAAKLGIADWLADGPKKADELAAAADAHPRSLYRVLRALASLGVFAKDDDGRFRLTPLAELLLTDIPGSLRPFVLSLGEPWWWNSWGQLLYSVKMGKVAFNHVFGKSA